MTTASRQSLTVVVASGNPVKLAAARGAFSDLLRPDNLEVVATLAASGVSDQPRSDDETRRGAANRASNARLAIPNGDFWVGMEGGVDRLGERMFGFAWMAILGRCGHLAEARSVLLPLPPRVQTLVEEGHELGSANDQVFDTRNSKQAGGAYGLLTDGLYTRESVYRETLTMALLPFASTHYPCAWHGGEVRA